MRDIIVARQDPAPEKYKTEEDFEEFTKDFAVTEYHHGRRDPLCVAYVRGKRLK